MRDLPPEPIFTTSSAYAAGCTESSLRHAVRTEQIFRVRKGIYVHAGTADPTTTAKAASLAHPPLPRSHLSAARLQAIPMIGRPKRAPEMTVPPRSNADIPGVHPYRARLREHEVVEVEGTLVTSPARTVVDLARHYPTSVAVPAIDYVLHEGRASAEELRDVFEFCRSWPGASRARRALLLSDSRAESPLESISRLVIPRLGLPVPEPQVTFIDRDGHVIGRGDFYWDEFGVVGEADGLSKYTDLEVMVAEKDREEGFDDVRLMTTRWGWSRVWSEHQLLRQRIGKAFARGSARDSAGLPRLWTPRSTPRTAVL